MPTVAAMIADPAAQELAREQIGTAATIRFCDTVDALTSLVAQGGVDAVIADLWDRSGASLLPAIAPLRAHGPIMPVILYFAPTPAALREVPDMIAAGRGLEVALRNHEHLGLTLRRVLRPPHVPSAAETLARHVVPLVPGPFRPFFLVSALKASPRLRVATAASWSGVARRTLERSLRRAHLPGASIVLGSCTALHAAWWLDVQGWSPKQIATEMQFSHTSAVTRVLQRHFGCSVKSLPDRGGFQGLLYRFESALLGKAG